MPYRIKRISFICAGVKGRVNWGIYRLSSYIFLLYMVYDLLAVTLGFDMNSDMYTLRVYVICTYLLIIARCVGRNKCAQFNKPHHHALCRAFHKRLGALMAPSSDSHLAAWRLSARPRDDFGGTSRSPRPTLYYSWISRWRCARRASSRNLRLFRCE